MHKPPFDNSYIRLGEQFFTRQLPEPVSSPERIRTNRPLAEYLGIDPDWLESETGVGLVAGNYVPDTADPVATVYAGHQFGNWVPRLGDGRAVLLGEVVAADGMRHDIQLKGSGRTPYSRSGDGRAPLGPVLREYVLCEAMAALGVPTTRALAAVTTGQKVVRESMLPGAVLARVAQSHIRVGTFQYFASRNDHEALNKLADHVMRRHYPDARAKDAPLVSMLEAVMQRQAKLVAQWQLLGFIHGVMNTDNMLVSGETIDYGPCAFLDHFDNDAVFSSIDHRGRYAYRNQAHIAHWNLAQLVNSLLPLLDDGHEEAIARGQALVDGFPDMVNAAYRSGMAEKLGLGDEQAGDSSLFQDLLELMQEHHTDYTLTFCRLNELAVNGLGSAGNIGNIFSLAPAFDPWLERWQARFEHDTGDVPARLERMRGVNPVFIPRNHLVEEVIVAAERRQDFAPFHSLVDVLARPFSFESSLEYYATPPLPGQEVRQTFCGT